VLERIGSIRVPQWRCTDCLHVFSSKSPQPKRCPRRGCRALALSHRRPAATGVLPADIRCVRCRVRERRPGRSECQECAQARRETQRRLYWSRRGMPVPPEDVSPALIST